MKRLSWLLALCALCSSTLQAQSVFDSHVHLHHGEASLQAYEAQVRKDGQDLAGFAGMWFGGPNQALAGDPAAIRAGNDGIIALAKKHPGMLPVATVHPYDGQAALQELARVAAAGVRVLKIHPHTQRFDAADPRVAALVQRAGELGLIVLMDNAGILPGDCQKLFNLALAAPDTTFIFAHMGTMNFRFWNILKPVKTAEGLYGDNIYFDLSGTVTMIAGSPIVDEFVWTIRNVGVDRVLLGSDYPQFPLALNADALEALPLNEQEKAQIRYGNAQRLFGLGKRD